MSEMHAFLHQFDATWSHEWESVRAALDGVNDDEAAYQAPCYAGETTEDGWPPPGTIAWQVAHLTHCKRDYTAILRSAGTGAGATPDAPPWVPVAAFAELRAQLKGAHEEERLAMSAITDAQLDDIAGDEMPLRDFLAMIIRHDAWHAAQIAVARRLFRTR